VRFIALVLSHNKGTDVSQKYMKMTKDAIFEWSSQLAFKDTINRRNAQGAQYLKFFLLVFLIWRPKSKNLKEKLAQNPSCLKGLQGARPKFWVKSIKCYLFL